VFAITINKAQGQTFKHAGTNHTYDMLPHYLITYNDVVLIES